MLPITDELIEKYFRGLCTGEEAAAVQQFLKEHPDHSWLAKEWEQADGISPLPANYTQQMYDEVETVIHKTANKTFSLWKYAAAAACVAGIVVSLFVLNKKSAVLPVVAKARTLADTAWAVQFNKTQNDMALVLADGSILTLSPNASVRYRAEFNVYAKREVFMTGRVFFEVAKNKQKPFTVYSSNLSTTALGTAFYVDAPDNTNKISVQLFEGKVVVALDGVKVLPVNSGYYLLPGQELVFNTVTGRAQLKQFIAKAHPKINHNARNILAQKPPAGSSFMFNNQTLAEVLDQLSAMYRVEIRYPKASIGNSYFIGKIDKDDSLDKIIHDIAILNRLSVKKQNGVYILTKK